MNRNVSLCELVIVLGWFMSCGTVAQELGIAEFPKLSAERDWPWWRGPQRNGIATSSQAPLHFNKTENVVWKASVPGRGHSSPIVVQNLVVLATADEQSKVQSVLAFDRKSGKQLWKSDLNQGGFPERNHAKNTEASPTVACDGERIYVVFFHHRGVHVTALDFQGQKVWQREVGPFDPKKYEYGYAPSPLIYRDSLIVAAEHDGTSFIAAISRIDGKDKWRTPRPQNITFSSPVVGRVAGRDQLLLSGSDQVTAYDPQSGKQLWSAPGTAAATCGTLVWDGDIVLASGGYPKSETLAVRADGSGTVLWRNNQKCYEQSMLAWKGYLYALTDNGVVYCWRINDGTEMWKQRLKGPVSASPVLIGEHIYWANELGTFYVFNAAPEKFELLAENSLGSESFASPAVAGNQIFYASLIEMERLAKKLSTASAINKLALSLNPT